MKVFVGSDHRGFLLKKSVSTILKQLGHEIVDLGTDNETVACDYPEISYKVGTQVVAHPGSRGILLCLSGIGHSIAANKIPGVYAALVYNREAAALCRQHNDSNVLVLGSKFMDDASVQDIVRIWLSTEFEGGRHQRRKEKIQEIERRFSNSNEKK